MNLPPIFALGTTALIGIAGLGAFFYPQFIIRNFIGAEKRLLLNIIENQYQGIIINYVRAADNREEDRAADNHEKDRDSFRKELSILSELSSRIEPVSEWPFNYMTFLTVLAGVVFPFVSILIGVLGLL